MFFKIVATIYILIACFALACSKKSDQTGTTDAKSTVVSTAASQSSAKIPADPTGFTATDITDTAVTFSWTDNASNEMIYEVESCAGAGCSNFAAISRSPFGAGVTKFTQTDLTPDTIYFFRIRATNGGGSSAWLTSTAITTLLPAPTNFHLNSSSTSSIAFSWTEGSTHSTAVEIQRCSGSGCTNFYTVYGSPFTQSLTSHTETGLTSGTVYGFRIRDTSSNNTSPWLLSGDVDTAVIAPTAITVGTITNSSIQISWSNNDSNVTGYEVAYCNGAGCTNFVDAADSPLAAGTTSYTLTGLNPVSTYRFKVRALNSGIESAWLISADIATNAATAGCSSPTTVVVDKGLKSTSTNNGRGLWSDLKIIPGSTYPATAYYDGSASGGTQTIKFAWWNGSSYQLESVAGDMLVAAGSATFVRLAFLSSGRPMIFWTTGGTTVKMAMRSAALATAGTWSSAVIDTVAGAASRAIEVAVSPLNQVGVIYLTNTLGTGRARFIYCDANCSSPAGFVAMNAAETVENVNINTAYMGTGIGWCQIDSATYYPAVVYPTATNTRFAMCSSASLSTCGAATGWSASLTNVVATTGVLAKLLIDPTTPTAKPAVLTRINAANLQVFEMASACNSSPPYTFTANAAVIGGATSGTAFATFLRDSVNNFYHIITNLSTTNVNYFNSNTSTLTTTTWNAAGTLSTVTLPAAGAGGGGADIANNVRQVYASYGTAAAPFNLYVGVVNDYTLASNSGTEIFYSQVPDQSGDIALNNNQTRNVSMASTSAGKPAILYVDNSTGTAAGAYLKYAYRSSLQASGEWQIMFVPGTSQPMYPSLAFDNNDKPWISFYEASQFRYYLVSNTATDGSGQWQYFQFPIGVKTSSAVAPANDDTSVAMLYSGGSVYPVQIVINAGAGGLLGVRSAMLNPTTGVFVNVAPVDTAGASYTNLSSAFDHNGNIIVGFYDITNTRPKFNYSTSGTSWLGTSVQMMASTTAGREGLSIALNPTTSRPAASFYDRSNNAVYYSSCTTPLSFCATAGNWTAGAVATTLGISGIPATTNEQLLNTNLSFSMTGTPYVTYITGTSATSQTLNVADNNSGSFTATTLCSSSSSGVTGASAVNFGQVGLHAAAVRTSLGRYLTAYIGPNNWLYVTSCGE